MGAGRGSYAGAWHAEGARRVAACVGRYGCGVSRACSQKRVHRERGTSGALAVSAEPISRREFLQLAAAASGGALLLGVYSATASDRVNPMLTPWVRIDSSGTVTLMASQSEMGQGISTTLAAALAHELYLSLSDVRVE